MGIRLQLPIRELLQPERIHETTFTGGGDRTEFGRAAHRLRMDQQLVSVERYRTEVPLQRIVSIQGLEVVIKGRADGLFPDGPVDVIEEIKSVEDVSAEPTAVHRMQACIYAWLLGENDGRSVDLLLTLINPLAGEWREIRETPDSEEVDREIHRRLARIVSSRLLEMERLDKRAAAAVSYVWPYPEKRPSQDEMEQAVRRTIREQRHLLLEAPTGSGKTAPILIGALHEAARTHARIAFATSRRAQTPDRVSFLEHQIPALLKGRALQLGTAAELCPEHNLLCVHQKERLQPIDPYDRPEWFQRLLESDGVIRPAEVKIIAQTHKRCALRLQRDLIPWMDIVIGDQNQLADPFVSHPGWFERKRGGRQTVLLVDEAHGLPERMRDRYRIQLTRMGIRQFGRFLEQHSPAPLVLESYHLLEKLDERVEDLLSPSVYLEETPLYEQWDPVDDEILPIMQRLDWILSQLNLRTETEQEIEFQRLVARTAAMQRNAEAWRGYLDRENGLLGIEPVQPGRLLKRRWAETVSTIAFSATLSPPGHVLEELGLPEDRSDAISIPDFTEPDRRLVLRYTGLSTRFDDREANLPQLAHLLSMLPAATDGGWLVFFPSHAYLEATASALAAYPVEVVPHRAGTPPLLTRRLLERAAGPAVHLMALGGAQAEGVGWECADLHGVVVVGPGFHPPAPDRELRRILWDVRGEDGFLRAYLLPSVARIVQAAGRLLRSLEQRGIVLLVGQRFGRHDIAEALPDSWRESECVEDMRELLQRINTWWG
ncbi:hypothetical protein GF324_04135 [bacterium]|nr:hypothetical protein [bacterium]